MSHIELIERDHMSHEANELISVDRDEWISLNLANLKSKFCYQDEGIAFKEFCNYEYAEEHME